MAGEINWGLLDPTMPGKIANSFFEGQQQQRQNALQDLAFKKAQQDIADDDAYRNAYKESAGDINALQRILGQKGLYKQANELTKQQLEMEAKRLGMKKDQAEIDTKTYKLGQDQTQDALVLLSSVQDQPSWVQAVSTYKRLYPQANIANLPGEYSPEVVQGLTRQLIGLKDPSKLLPTIQTRNTGGTTDTLAIDPITGKPTVTGSVTNTQSPDSAASVAATIRGQNMTDARSRETLAQSDRHFQTTQANAGNTFDSERGVVVNTRTGTATPVMQSGAPLGAKDKPLTESQGKDLLFGKRMQEANRLISELEQGGTNNAGRIKGAVEGTLGAIPLVGEALANAGGAAVNAAPSWAGGTSGQQQQYGQAKRDFINAVLRKESGAAIGKNEFDSADKQYFPQVGDRPEVIAQKARNRALAIQGIMSGVPVEAQKRVQPQVPGRSSSGQIKFLGFEE